jgi:RHS repeat-associated protein
MGQGEKVRYVYNGLGQRVFKMDSGSTIVYHYDNLNRLIAETDQHGGIIREYIWLDHELIAVGESGAMYYVHTNHRNQPHLATDEDGQVVWRGVSTPFGSTSIDNGQGGPSGLCLNLRLPGQYFDAETGFHHNYHRDYSPELGRYLQADPIGLNGGMNLYGYCGNDPVNREDRWGLDYIDPEQDPSGQYGFDPENYDTDDFATGTLDDATQQDGQNQTADIGGNWEQDYLDPFDDELDEMIQEAANEELAYSYKEGGVIDEDLADIVKAINSQQKAFQVELKTDPHYKKPDLLRILESVYGKGLGLKKDHWEIITPPASKFKGKVDPYSAYRKARNRVEIISSPAFRSKTGIDLGANHVGVYDPWSGKYFDGMTRSSSTGATKDVADAPDDIADFPKREVNLTNGMTGEEFLHGLQKSGVFDSGPWFGGIYDCHVELQKGFEELGQNYPGSPEGRVDWDEKFEEYFGRLFNEGYNRIMGRIRY